MRYYKGRSLDDLVDNVDLVDFFHFGLRLAVLRNESTNPEGAESIRGQFLGQLRNR